MVQQGLLSQTPRLPRIRNSLGPPLLLHPRPHLHGTRRAHHCGSGFLRSGFLAPSSGGGGVCVLCEGACCRLPSTLARSRTRSTRGSLGPGALRDRLLFPVCNGGGSEALHESRECVWRPGDLGDLAGHEAHGRGGEARDRHGRTRRDTHRILHDALAGAREAAGHPLHERRRRAVRRGGRVPLEHDFPSVIIQDYARSVRGAHRLA
mmetsp:Transcript_13569/g.32970  ORF Transcript_13569/g.32970 Transcript_13569/m.32970 type:complete len:207 (-) Transcript_13569:153-773(-)